MFLNVTVCVQMSFGLFRMCIRGDCVIDVTNRRLIRHFAAGGNIYFFLQFLLIFAIFHLVPHQLFGLVVR